MKAPRAAALVVYLLATACLGFAQPHVDPRHMYERVLAIVPMIGAGTPADPKRPLYAPAPHEKNPNLRTGILGFTYVLSDDGKFALVELVMADRAGFQHILADAAVPSLNVQAFVRGVHQRADVEAAFRKYKKNFDFDKFGVRMQ
jgi:hypothetical protein